ncbi:MAG TPA: alpha-E domain-containing protein [Acidimicrobiia bacterium]|nr:alpha-E domain-containing protein [Acidimicrobiia bacterium]
MLARHAENLFWIGRYVERAEDSARLLDVTYHGLLEAGSERTPADVWSECLEMLMLEDEGIEEIAGDAIGERLIANRSEPGSLVAVVGKARENARTTRELLSSEVFEALNDLHLYLANTDLVAAARDRPYEVLRTVKSSCQAVNGSVDASMPRGEGYRFFLGGQRLERALISSRVLRVWHRRLGRLASQAAFSEWVRLLRSVSAYEAYLRTYRAAMDEGQVVAFLLQSEDFPRSVLHCVHMVENLLDEIDTGEVGSGVRRQAGRLRSSVEFVDLATLDQTRLESFLESLETGVLDLAGSLEKAYFRPAGPVFMHSYEAF